ncbi:IS110 family transposase [Demequina rhizosphaerae]|uniref:IS110 family transposase n=1 Tax=Demequina rhizosphaerae TaxID=1638985 RepID=UPI0007804412|nr:IS110 family transposase [Demequina rhizosphaerae]
MTIVANTYTHVIGIDTHARTHTLTVIAAATAARGATAAFPTTARGLSRAGSWIARHGSHLATLVVIEGAGSYGAVLARVVRQAGYRVVEPLPIPKSLRAGRGKSDPIDAALIASSVLHADVGELRNPRDDQGVRAAVTVLLAGRELLTRHRSASVNALTALVRLHDLGIDARGPLKDPQIATIAAWRDRTEDIATATARAEARRLARAIIQAKEDLADNHDQLHALVLASPAAVLLDEVGIGTVNAATILTAWSHPGRIHSEAAFASLAGACPIPASSGNRTHHRLNRGGDRRLNRALHSIVLTRKRHDPATRDYVARRTAEGLGRRAIDRSLKRYLARHLYRALEHPSAY